MGSFADASGKAMKGGMALDGASSEDDDGGGGGKGKGKGKGDDLTAGNTTGGSTEDCDVG